jgi:hypothetical protein
LKKDRVNNSNVPDGLSNVTEEVPSLPPVESQDTAYKPKSKVTNCYTMHALSHTRSNVKEGGIILEVPMDDEDEYFSEAGRNWDKRIESYVSERIPMYPPLALPPVQIKGFQHLYKSTKTTSSERVLVSHKGRTRKHGLPRNDNTRRINKKNRKMRDVQKVKLSPAVSYDEHEK